MANSCFGCTCGNLKATSPPAEFPTDIGVKPVKIKPGGFSIKNVDDISIVASRESCFEVTCKRCKETFRIKIENNIALFQKINQTKRCRRLSVVESNLPFQLQKFITSPQYSPLFFDTVPAPPITDEFLLEPMPENIDDVDIDFDLMFSKSAECHMVGSYCNQTVLSSGGSPY